MNTLPLYVIFFFFNDTATTEIYTLSLHDALPISEDDPERRQEHGLVQGRVQVLSGASGNTEEIHQRKSAQDRKSTRLNSSHSQISYAVFCLKKKKKKKKKQKNKKTKTKQKKTTSK